jgi:hypothetical protein
MRITILPDAVQSDADWGSFDRILHRIEDGAHEWEINDPNALADSCWLAQLRRNHRQLYEGAAKKGAYPANSIFRRQLIVADKPICNVKPDQLRPEQAAVFVNLPLYVLMENRFTDGALLDTAIEFLASEPLPTLHRQDIKLIEYVHAGGNGEIPKHIDEQVSLAARRAIPVRMVVFTDSDGRYPGHTDDNPCLVHEKSMQNSIPCCVLKKRAIENYIPDEIFNAWAGKIDEQGRQINRGESDKIAVLLKLSTEQRDHFSIKLGFGGRGTRSQEEIGLYASLGEDDRKKWPNGLGDKVIFWLRDHKNVLSAQVLKQRDQGGDLDQIINMIMDEL